MINSETPVTPKGYSSPTMLAIWVSGLLILGLLVGVAAVLSDIAELALIDRAVDGDLVTPSEADSSDDRQQAIAVSQVAVAVVTAIFFVAWFHRAYKNILPLGAERLRFGTGWAIGGWLVPILNLIRPKQIANDIWRVSDPKQAGPGRGIGVAARSNPLINCWWGSWLFAGLFWRFLQRSEPSDLEEALRYSRLVLASDIWWMVTTILAVYVVRRVTENQETSARLAPSDSPAQGSEPSPGGARGRSRLPAQFATWSAVVVLATAGLLIFYNALEGDTTLHQSELSSGWTWVEGSGFDISVPTGFEGTTSLDDYLGLIGAAGPEAEEAMEMFEASPSAFKYFAVLVLGGDPEAGTAVVITTLPSGGRTMLQTRRLMVDQLSAGGDEVEDVDEIASLNGLPAVRIHSNYRDRNVDRAHLTYAIGRGSTNWVVEFDTTATEFMELFQTFERIVESLSIHE